LRVMADDEFRRGEIEIQWLERRLPSLLGTKPPRETRDIAAIAAALIADRERHAPSRIAPNTASSSSNSGSTGDAWTRVARLESLR